MNDERSVRIDRLRYTKNALASRLAILAILFDVLFFVSIYKSDQGNYYYNILIGASILYNLVFMLTVFLASEGVKNYRIGYSYLLIAVGIIQILRIFIIPVNAHAAASTVKGVTSVVMGSAQFVRVIVWLCLSAACCFASAAVNIQKSRALALHMASLDGQKA